MMQPTFIKTSKGFINLARVESASAGSNDFIVWLIGGEYPYQFTGKEAARLLTIFNTIALFDATKEESK